MRTAFIRALEEAASADPRVTLVVGDLGYSVIESFAERFPRQFLNVGVAEQNMAGVAAGLALSGRIVFTYSIANFPILRCLEQIRNDICYHKVNVKIVAVGGGFAYGTLGVSHHATEDLAIMRALPEMTVVAPGDPTEAGGATRAIVAHPGPCYLRLGKAGEPVIHPAGTSFELGKAIQVRPGTDLTLVVTGGMLANAVLAAEELAKQLGVQARVLSMHTLKPLDEAAVMRAARETGMIVTIEEHSLVGGLGSAVADLLAHSELNVRFRALGLTSRFHPVVGSQDYLRAQHGLSVAGLVASVASRLAVRSRD